MIVFKSVCGFSLVPVLFHSGTVLVTAQLYCLVTARLVNAAAWLSSLGTVLSFSHGAVLSVPLLGCLDTAWLSCLVTTRCVNAVAKLSSYGLVAFFSCGTVC